MNRFTKMNVCVQKYVEKFIVNRLENEISNEETYSVDNEFGYFRDSQEFFEYFTDYWYFTSDYEVQNFLTENDLNTVDYLSMYEEIKQYYDDSIDVNDMMKCMNTYFYHYYHEFNDSLIEFFMKNILQKKNEKKIELNL